MVDLTVRLALRMIWFLNDVFYSYQRAGRTGQIKEHKVYKQVVSSNNMLRHSKVQQLTSGSLATKELRRYLNATDFAQSDYECDTYGNITK